MHDGSMSTSPLRCHLLIGPPGSGQTTLANQLAPLLQGADGGPCLVLSTDVIRAELFGDAAVQGPWNEIRTVLLQRLQTAVAAGRPVIIDATHARRPWRLMYTQQLQLPHRRAAMRRRLQLSRRLPVMTCSSSPRAATTA